MTTYRSSLKARTRQVSREFLRFVDEQAAELRQRAEVGPTGRLDPWHAASAFGVIIADLNDLTDLQPEDRTHLLGVDARVWSGMGIPLPGGKLLALLHPDQTVERKTVTVMEEVAHVHLGHKPSQLVTQPSGLVKREYDAQAEWEAYCVAAAALLPAKCVARGVWSGKSAAALAAEHGVSVELVEFRIRTLRLWPEYRAHAA